MKRGLVLLDPAEVPEREWRRRVGALRERIAADGIDVALVYGDVFRSDDIAYLTNLCVYWNEGVLAVPATGEPTFLTKLSPRVYPWLRRVSTVEDIRSGRNFADLVAAYLADRPDARVGIVDAGLWPESVLEQLAARLGGHRVRELGGLVRDLRLAPAAPEAGLLRTAGALLDQAATAAAAPGLGVPERVSVAERTLRWGGYLDVLTQPSATTDGVSSLRITGQYRTCWLQAARLSGQAPWTARLTAALDAAIAAVRPGVTGADLRAAAGTLPAGGELNWVHQADLSTNGEYAHADPAAVLAEGAVLALAADVLFDDGGYAVVADTVLVTGAGQETLTRGGAT
ncbi:MAG TPA: aminopeptidase P family N-terminal domain-containing protein [Pseudonocardiaceae bacterium]|nr:aminopeptidase P family N-terminal domain-containing protein [Pseudonocardiaceae bacterium]